MKDKMKAFIMLQIALLIMSFGGVCSKLAGRQDFLSLPFFFFYGLLILILFIYAIIWQQVLKSISLTVAYACKGVCVIYGIIWGILFFQEKLRWNMVAGAVLVLIGVYCYVFGEYKEQKQ